MIYTYEPNMCSNCTLFNLVNSGTIGNKANAQNTNLYPVGISGHVLRNRSSKHSSLEVRNMKYITIKANMCNEFNLPIIILKIIVQSIVEMSTKIMENSCDEFSFILQEIEEMRNKLKVMANNLRRMRKDSLKHNKPRQTVSGFVKPVPISKELADMLGVSHDEPIARNVVNKKITTYIKENDLQVQEDKQTFRLDESLAKLFSMNVGDIVHYFKMQTHLKTHYPKTIVS